VNYPFFSCLMTNLYQALFSLSRRQLLLAAGLGCPLAGLAQYTPGNLVVVQVGDGTSLTSNTFATSLVEYTPAGVAQSTIILNNTGSNKLTNTGNGNSEGMLTLSADGRFLVTTGYDAPVGTAAATATAATVPRTVARINGSRSIDISTVLTDAFTSNTIRSAASVDGSAFWVAGVGNSAGLRYAAAGASTSSSLSTTVANIRAVRIARNNVYFSTGTGTPGIYLLGPASNTSTGQAATLLIGTGAGTSPYSFVLLDRDPTVLGIDAAYIADDSNGISKWAFNGSTWANVGTISTSARGLTGTLNPNGSVTLYATTRTSAGSNDLVTTTDSNPNNASPSSTTTTSLFKAPANVALRGVEFAPGTAVVLPVVLTRFGASRTGAGVQLRWATASEKNSARFDVQRSLDGRTFATVVSVPAAGSSLVARPYAATDGSAPAAALYYRLRQVDQDGTTAYSAVVPLAPAAEAPFMPYPNPTRDVVTVAASTAAGQLAEVRDLHGRLVRASRLAADGRLSLAGLATGTYALLLDGHFRQLLTKTE
jgi:hypothetical protein